MNTTDHLLVFGLMWILSNILLTTLMGHNILWEEAKNAGMLAFKALGTGGIFLIIAMFLMVNETHRFSIEYITHNVTPLSPEKAYIILLLISTAAFIQSGLWPFHRWLTSSLNSPTPVSALMHAGLVNGGSILIVKFSPLFIMYPKALLLLFIMGTITAIIGTAWKLIQTDIKRMLACSTMAQMGFMLIQCGLGLFPSAIAHLCWHGIFKSYLFLNAGSALNTKKTPHYPATFKTFLISLLGGAIGAAAFALITNKSFILSSASTFLICIAFMATAQLMQSILNNHTSLGHILWGLISSLIAGLLYGFSVHLIESALSRFYYPEVVTLKPIHFFVLLLFFSLWALMSTNMHKSFFKTRLWQWLYVKLLNASQPSSNTITVNRSAYRC